MEVIILAGGFGTRLSHVVQDVPKPMAPIKEIPFLVYILEYLLKYHAKKIIMATGYKSEVIENYFGNKYKGVEIIYSREDEPLGTGGAIKKALEYCEDDHICVLNGDTYFDVDLNLMSKLHIQKNSNLTIGLKKMYNFERYGVVEIKDDEIIKFDEKKKTVEGYINGGVYFLKRDILSNFAQKKFSFENDYMERYLNKEKINSFISDGYFIDIGISEDYYKANKELIKY